MFNIVFAHNDEETRNTFYKIFADLGYKITTVVTHKEVLEILSKERPDYIILDSAISDIPAQDILKKIKIIDENIKVVISPSDKNALQFIQNVLKILTEKQPPLPPPKETKGASFKANILVVDDEKECVELIKNYLSEKGYVVNTAFSGEEAIAKIKTSKPDIVLLDLRMPGMDGIIVLKTIKDIDKSISVIIATGVEDDEIIKEVMVLGGDGYLVKPFNLAKLEITILSKMLEKKNQFK